MSRSVQYVVLLIHVEYSADNDCHFCAPRSGFKRLFSARKQRNAELRNYLSLQKSTTREEELDEEWSGKKTVKAGQIRSNMTARSVESDQVLSPPAYSKSAGTNSKVMSANRSTASSTEPSTDDNSTIPLNEGYQFPKQKESVLIEDSHWVEARKATVDVQSRASANNKTHLDTLSVDEGYDGGCLACSDLQIDLDSTSGGDEIDIEAEKYWNRVQTNRSRSQQSTLARRNSFSSRRSHSLHRNSSRSYSLRMDTRVYEETDIEDVKTTSFPETHLSNDGVDVEKQDDLVEIEVVHNPKKTRTKPKVGMHSNVNITEKIAEAVTHVTSYEQTRKALSSESRNLLDSDLGSFEEAKTYAKKMGLQPLQPKKNFGKLVRMISKGTLPSKIEGNGEDLHPRQISCGSNSSVDLWGNRGDKYKSPLDPSLSNVDSQASASHSLAGSELMEESFMREQKHDEIRTSAKAPFVVRSRAPWKRHTQSLSLNISALSSSVTPLHPKLQLSLATKFLRASKSVSVNKLSRGLKSGVSHLSLRLNKKGTEAIEVASDNGLVVCIDGKGDRLIPGEEPEAENDEESQSCRDHEESTIETATYDDVEEEELRKGLQHSPEVQLVSVDTPFVFELCIMGRTSMSVGPGSGYEEENELASSSGCTNSEEDEEELYTVNTDWFLDEGEEKKEIDDADAYNKSLYSCNNVEETYAEQDTDGETQSVLSSETDSGCSIEDTNSIKSDQSSVEDSSAYDLFPAASFTGLSGIKCYQLDDAGCATTRCTRLEDAKRKTHCKTGGSRQKSKASLRTSRVEKVLKKISSASKVKKSESINSMTEPPLMILDDEDRDSVIECTMATF